MRTQLTKEERESACLYPDADSYNAGILAGRKEFASRYPGLGIPGLKLSGMLDFHKLMPRDFAMLRSIVGCPLLSDLEQRALLSGEGGTHTIETPGTPGLAELEASEMGRKRTRYLLYGGIALAGLGLLIWRLRK